MFEIITEIAENSFQLLQLLISQHGMKLSKK